MANDDETAKPAAAEPKGSTEPRFTRERLLDLTEGPRITGQPHYVIVGALDGDDAAKFTRAQIQKKVESFFERPVPQEG